MIFIEQFRGDTLKQSNTSIFANKQIHFMCYIHTIYQVDGGKGRLKEDGEKSREIISNVGNMGPYVRVPILQACRPEFKSLAPVLKARHGYVYL